MFPYKHCWMTRSGTRAQLSDRARSFISIVLSALFAAAWAPVAAAQTFLPQGPSPIFGPAQTIQSGDAPPNGTSVGAVQAIVTDPTDANKMYIGTVNGGVWETLNGGTTWTPLSDNQRSLSIASLAVDPTNPNVLIAGTGVTSSTSLGGPKIGLLYSTTGGASWSVLDQGLPATSIVGVAVRGNTILAAASEPFAQNTAGGLFRSVNGGAFQAVTFGNGGPVAVTSLASNSNQSNFYAAVLSTDASQNGIWSSINNSGQTWTLVKTLPLGQTARLAMGPNSSVVAGVYNCSTCSGGNQLVSLMLSQNGQPFVTLNVPIPNTSTPDTATTFPGDYANRLLPLAIDPANQNIIYLGGSDVNVNGAFSVAAVRIRVTDIATGTATVEPLTLDGTANGSTAHADARAFAFDANGRLIMTTDGGVYVRTNPQGPDGTGTWTGLNGSTLQVGEAYAIAFDAVSKRMVMAAQDIGVSYQNEPNGQTFRPLTGGDGHNAAVNDKTLSGHSAIYTSAQNLSALTRWTVNASGTIVTQTVFDTKDINFDPSDFTDCSKGSCLLPIPSKMVLNKVYPTMMAFGTNYAYTTVDTNAASDKLVLTNLGSPFSTITPGVTDNEITALAYGTSDNPNALLAGSNKGPTRLFLSSTGGPNSLIPTAYTGGTPTSVVFDYRAYARFFAVDQTNLWATTNAGTTFTNSWTSNLTTLGIILPTSLEFISNNGVNALLVGGVNTFANGNSPLAVADSDTLGNLANWRPFGSGLPNTFVYKMSYNPTVDVLAMSLLGRGTWLLYDTTAYFSTATVLRFGLADNDSAPDASFLTGARPLEKVGAGTLAISGTTSYTGATSVLGGMLLANASLASSSGLTIDAGGTVRGIGTLPNTVVKVNATLYPGNTGIGTLTVNDSLTFNAGSLYRVDASPQTASRTNVGGTGGTATLNGSVAVVATPGAFAPGRTFTILSATGGHTGAFADATTNYPFLQAAMSYDTNDVFLTLASGGFVRGGNTANQAAVGVALDRSVATSNGDFATVLDALAFMSQGQAPAVLDALSSQPYANFGTTNLQGANLFMNSVGQQMAAARGGAGGGQRQALAQACDIEACETTSPWGAWASALGGLGSVATNGNASSLTYNFGGGAAGLDYRLDPSFLVGFGVGYAAGNQWVNGLLGRGWTDSVSAAAYASFTQGAFYVDALAGYAYSDNRLQRPIAIPGLQPRTANGGTGANQALGQVEAGYKVGVYAPALATLTPFGRLQASSVTQNAFSEWGANSLNLNVAQQTTNSLRSTLGVDLAGPIII